MSNSFERPDGLATAGESAFVRGDEKKHETNRENARLEMRFRDLLSLPGQTSTNGQSVTAIETGLLNAKEAASFLGVSETWVRRHVSELPSVSVGRLLRFDAILLCRQFQGRRDAGSRLKPKRKVPMGYMRYQRSVVKRGKKGQQVWYGVWREDVPKPDGGFTRRQRMVRLGFVSGIPNRSTAYEHLSRLMGQKPSTHMKFSELVERWKAAVVPTIKDSTATYYQKMLKSHVLPAFGIREVASITREDVELFLANKARLFCKNTLRGMRVSLGRVLSWAVKCKWIEENPCAGVELPHAGSKVKRTILKPEQVAAIVNKLREPYATLVLFLAVSGLRIGEAIAVKWSDFEGDTLHIRRRIFEGKVGTTKTESSQRSLPIPAALIERMKKLGDGEWIFRARNGAPINPKNAAQRYIRPVTRELGIPLGGWHDFRHTLSTRLLKRYPTKVVSELLGHSNVQTTLETYQHIETEDFRAPLNEMANELLASF